MSHVAFRWTGIFSVVAALLSACTSTAATGPDGASESAAASTVALKVMQFNIEYGGDRVDFGSVSKAIEAADADVVAIQEGYAKMPEIAADLGWDYYDTRTQTVSKYPLLTPSGPQGGLLYVELEGGVVALYNVHLPSTAYGPNKVLAGESAEEVLARESRGRLSALQPILDVAMSTVDENIPTVVLGDFNAPSHRDWTEQTVGLREQVLYPLEWPTSVAAEAAGLLDVYRSIHPDPVENPGLTWPASRPFVKGYNPGPAGKPADRIDLMYVGGAAVPTAVSIVGEKSSELTDIPVSPWPSDHRAVVATLDVVPGVPDPLVSIDQRVVETGVQVGIRYLTRTADAATIALTPSGDTREQAVLEEPVTDPSQGSWDLPSGQLSPGAYDVLLLAEDERELAQTTLWLVTPGTKPAVTTDAKTYAVDESIQVSWELSPGNRWDWIGIYKQGADPNIAYYKLWAYTDATITGSTTLDGDSASGKWPLPPGEYSVYLLADDSYVKLAGSDFTIKD